MTLVGMVMVMVMVIVIVVVVVVIVIIILLQLLLLSTPHTTQREDFKKHMNFLINKTK